MDDHLIINLSLDEARAELAKRWKDVELKARVTKELGANFLPEFADNPRGVLFRQLCSADNNFHFFYQCSNYIGGNPLILEYLDDIFVHFNDAKMGLGRLRVTLEDGTPATVDIMNFHENEKKKLRDVVIKAGGGIVDFHHNLFEVSKYKVTILENSKWFKSIGKASEYYYFLLLHFVAHGFLFETFLTKENLTTQEDYEKECGFTKNIVIPALERINENFGLSPLIVTSFPMNQTSLEDFYWYCYPPHINDYIVEYAREHNLPFKKLSLK